MAVVGSEKLERVTIRRTGKRVVRVLGLNTGIAASPQGRETVQRSIFKASPNTPRQIRARVALVSVPGSRKVAGESVAKPSSPNQSTAQNQITGRFAMGPWLGPFDTHPSSEDNAEDALPSLLYLDREGSVHFDLDDNITAIDAAKADLEQQAEKAKSSMILSTQQAIMQQQDFLKAAKHGPYKEARRKPWTSGKATVKSMHMINQPRRMN